MPRRSRRAAVRLAKAVLRGRVPLGRDLRRFADDRDGIVAVVFAFMILPLMAVVGMATDYAYAASQRARLQNAVDSATLSAVRMMTARTSEQELEAYIKKFVAAHVRSPGAVSISVTMDRNARAVAVTATLQQPTFILPVININSIEVGVRSQAQIGRPYIEVALVLDNSGSMVGSRIESLRGAAKTLTRKVLDMAYMPGDTKVALVPFAGMVNVGPQNASQSWMDTQALSPVHSENFSPAANRFQLYQQMRNVTWAGCVEARPQPHDVTDSAPSAGTPATLFVPSFAPDEPDEPSPYWYWNSYIPDAGSCGPLGSAASLLTRQTRTCKYNGATPDQSLANGTRRGPNQICDSTPILPLTSTSDALINAITAMEPYGGTNIHEGVMWGWRVLSPGPPFTEGRPYSDTDNRKFMVLMTDGTNDAIGLPNNINGSFYSAYGFATAGRLGTTSNVKADLVAKMNERTQLACTNAKAAGIVVFTVALSVTDPATLAMLGQCASDPSLAQAVTSDSELGNAFETIGNQISRLRLVN